LIFGRELRLPAQLSDPKSVSPTALEAASADVRSYASRLNASLRLSWSSALEATLAAQAESVRDATIKSQRPARFEPGDRVCMRLPGHANKLQFIYSGPYRVVEALSDTRYRLRDLENRLVKEEVHISNLRPYHTFVDEEPLADDEYIVEKLLDRRSHGDSIEYLVKWRGYSIREATWEPRSELLRRCSDLLDDCDRSVEETCPEDVESPEATSSSARDTPLPLVLDAPSSRTRSRLHSR